MLQNLRTANLTFVEKCIIKQFRVVECTSRLQQADDKSETFGD